jgi:hypothetical protein
MLHLRQCELVSGGKDRVCESVRLTLSSRLGIACIYSHLPFRANPDRKEEREFTQSSLLHKTLFLVQHSVGRGAYFRLMNPLSCTIRSVFLFPDGNEFLDRVYGIPAGLECLGAVRATHRDRHAHLTNG